MALTLPPIMPPTLIAMNSFKLAALVPRPRVNLTRFRGVFSPNSKHRVWMWVTPARRGKGSGKVAEGQGEKTSAQRHVTMTWAQELKRVFNIDVETCRARGSTPDSEEIAGVLRM